MCQVYNSHLLGGNYGKREAGWDVLTTGKPHDDEVVFVEGDGLNELVKFLNKFFTGEKKGKDVLVGSAFSEYASSTDSTVAWSSKVIRNTTSTQPLPDKLAKEYLGKTLKKLTSEPLREPKRRKKTK